MNISCIICLNYENQFNINRPVSFEKILDVLLAGREWDLSLNAFLIPFLSSDHEFKQYNEFF